MAQGEIPGSGVRMTGVEAWENVSSRDKGVGSQKSGQGGIERRKLSGVSRGYAFRFRGPWVLEARDDHYF